MSYQNITVEREDRLYIVTINRPDVMNALNPQTHAEMDRAFDEFEQDPQLWVAIITGAGDAAFCAGGDISAMVDAKTEDDYKVPDSGYGVCWPDSSTLESTCSAGLVATTPAARRPAASSPIHPPRGFRR